MRQVVREGQRYPCWQCDMMIVPIFMWFHRPLLYKKNMAVMCSFLAKASLMRVTKQVR